MATAHPLPVPANPPMQIPAEDSPEQTGEQALVSSTPVPEEEEQLGANFTGPVARLPVELDVAIPVRDFRIRNLLALVPGAVIESQWNHGEDLPLSAGDVQLAWSEFEVIESGLAVRITHLA